MYDVKELAERLNVSVKTIRKHVALGDIPGIVRVGRCVRFEKTIIEKAINSGTLW